MIFIYIEKEELVNLVLIHVNNSSSYSSSADGNTGNNETDENCSNPFDQIKQTCQNLFTSFTDKLASGECLQSIIIIKLHKGWNSNHLYFKYNRSVAYTYKTARKDVVKGFKLC